MAGVYKRRHNIFPVTRENYLDLAYLTDVPEWTAELEAVRANHAHLPDLRRP